MNNRIININKKLTRNGFEDDLPLNGDDSALFEKIGYYMNGLLDMYELKHDPALSTTMDNVNEMIFNYKKKISGNKENENFIKEIFSTIETENNLNNEIKYIKQEINEKNLNLVTSEWVKEWHAKKQKMGTIDPKSEEIRNFITEAINSHEAEQVKIIGEGNKNNFRQSLFVKYISLSAAALIGAFILIRTLLPSSNPENLFNSYYKPFDAISPVTRSMNNNATDDYTSAVSSYKTGNYQVAAAEFAGVVEKDPSLESARFFLALSQIALENYSQSVNLLSAIANSHGEYGKEARWYLGLSYLKTGNRQKASECFEFLAKSDGFYKDRSEKILRRLK